MFVFFFKQKTAYEMRISYWSSDVCSSDLSRWRSQLRPHSERPLSAVCSHKPILKAPVLRHPPSHCTSASERTSRSASWPPRSEEHTSELQSLMRISYAVFCLKKKTTRTAHQIHM